MIKYEIKAKNDTIYVSLNVNSPNERALLTYEGDQDVVSGFKEFLENAYGAFGHTIGQATSAIDLHYAMSNQQQFQARLIEGQDLVTKYDPEIPDGAVT
ncbi:hypothetical protein G7B40_040245 [Aetokthonos hydrillicola Thurmond2011]|uniref:Uncharacterized protein n=1 Tax=Aetokthonos hydrillicola Thurmond2011 TaxID=2712845 RepID=A0AAP5IFM5_9CYAN|nr:hypothetical protein [Aetokthonos hydrillicola]MBO3459960.1 hypothetical protein [Aetokthonos hydrillicola CCALA 1050]MBW4584079.1 hypothetical protein [Aetokthonos hydrillicola CCALA 1050]MDR9900721.1 hypothetical protein [Aetokthonos hydrillicola Thurmond2011]